MTPQEVEDKMALIVESFKREFKGITTQDAQQILTEIANRCIADAYI